MITRQLRVQQQLQRLRPWQLWGRWLPQLRGQQQQLQLRHQQLQQQIASAGARLSPLWRPGQERRERLALQWTALSFSSLMEQFVLLLLPLMCGALVHHRCQLHPFHLQHPTWLVCLRHHPQLMLWVCLRHLECRALVPFGANSTSTKLGWFAFGTTHSPGCRFPFGDQHTELWFTFGANSPTTTTLVQVPASASPHCHLWSVPGRLPRARIHNVLCLLHQPG